MTKFKSVFYYFFSGLFVIALSCVNHDLRPKKFDCLTSTLSIKLDSVHKASSCTATDGIIYVTAQGGKEPYSYRIDNNLIVESDSIGGLHLGAYSITVIDENGCEKSLDNTEVPAEGFEFSTSVEADKQCLVNHDGTITIDVTNGTGPFQYQIGNGDFSYNNLFENLSYGAYNLKIRDAIGCEVPLHVTVPKGFTGVTWSTDVLPIVKEKCATSGCHDGKTRVDYRLYPNAKKNATQMKALTGDGSMPFDGPGLTPDQIKIIACWVDDGALDN